MVYVSKAKTNSSRQRMGKRPFVLLAAAPLPVLAIFGAVLLSLKHAADPAAAQFAAYPAEEKIQAKPKRPTLDGFDIPKAYKPFIVIAAREGPNFAGAYTVVPYDLKNGEQTVLVISARSGTVHKAPPATSYNVKFRLDSRLLIYEPDRKKAGSTSTRYFEFRGGRFLSVDTQSVYQRHKVDAGGTAARGRFTSR